MSEQKHYEGGCYCGKVRFLIKGPATGTQICHCSICRRLQGASLGLIASFFPVDNFSVTAGGDQLTEYLSPLKYSRMFCKNCGTRVFIAFDKAEIDIK